MINILIQLPVVALFIWYFDRLSSRFEGFLREERSARDKVLGDLLTEVKALKNQVLEHDEKMDLAVAIMQERQSQAAAAGVKSTERPSRPVKR